MEIIENINSSLEALSIILIFIIMFNNIVLTEYHKNIDIEKHSGKTENTNRIDKLKRFRYFRIIPILITDVICTYLYIPSIIKIIKNTSISLWNFDLLLTSFMIIFLCLFSMTIIQIVILNKICKRIKKLST